MSALESAAVPEVIVTPEVVLIASPTPSGANATLTTCPVTGTDVKLSSVPFRTPMTATPLLSLTATCCLSDDHAGVPDAPVTPSACMPLAEDHNDAVPLALTNAAASPCGDQAMCA